MNKKNSTFKRLMIYLITENKLTSALVLFFITLSALASVSSSLFLKQLIDVYIAPMLKQSIPDYQPLAQAIMVMIAIYAVGVISMYAYSKLLIVITQKTLRNLRIELFTHMEKLPIKFFDSHENGDIMSIYTSDIDTLRQVISQSIPQCIGSIITIVAVFIAMLSISIPLSVIVLVMVLIIRIMIKVITKKSSKFFNLQQQQIGKQSGYVEEIFQGIKVVKVFGYEKESKLKFDSLNEALFHSAYNANSYANILMPIIGNLGHLSYVLTAFLGGVFTIYGISSLTIGGLASFLQLNRSFNGPITQISQQLNSVIMGMAGAKRIFALLDEEVEVDNGNVTLSNVLIEDNNVTEVNYRTKDWAWKKPLNNELVPLQGKVDFDNVSFGYNDEKMILKDISLYARPGEKVAFVGATGAGKTTITNLINRFYDIQEGSITYDGIDVKDIKKSQLRKSLGIVLQDTHLFEGSIRDNIIYGNHNATEEEMLAASKLANAHTFIKHLEHGYDTILTSDGSSLSQGQRQLLSIARAALANSPVLILDEATSSIDSRTEKIVQHGMDKLMAGRTVFVIAHRLSTIKNADVIMVMDHGRIIERGNHDALIKQEGVYYQLFTGGLQLD